MSENILSVEDLKFLENMYANHGMQCFSMDDEGMKVNQGFVGSDSNFSGEMPYLSEIARKLKFRLNYNFQVKFSSRSQFDVVRL
mgnify:CR=1 FL=1